MAEREAKGRHTSLKDCGWVWEGQGLDPGVPPSVFGVGEGAEFFGLRRAIYIFHPNNDLGLAKLGHLEEVACDISKWKFEETSRGSWHNYVDARPETVGAEAENLSRLSLKYPNVTGAFHDDMLGLVRREGYTPEQYHAIYEAVRGANPELKLWVVVYTHELDPASWQPFLPYIDIVNLWVWNAGELPQLAENVGRCREIFPGKPINVGCYLRDYPTAAPVPMDMLKGQWREVRRLLDRDEIEGYSILATVLIDGQLQQAEWVRDFIAGH